MEIVDHLGFTVRNKYIGINNRNNNDSYNTIEVRYLYVVSQNQ